MKNMGDGRRKARVEKEIQEIISRYIIEHLRNEIPGLITVSRIQMPADFRTARVFVSYYAPTSTEDKTLDVAEELQSWASDIQDEISHSLKMRYCPKITFINDETTEKILKIEKTLSEISKNPSLSDELDEDND